MAEVAPLRALYYDPDRVGSLDAVASPPYDVIDDALRSELASRSPYNVVNIDLPVGEDRYGQAANTLSHWREEGVVRHDHEPAIWALTQRFTGPDGDEYTRHGFFCRVKVQPYGEGRIRPHERTHPGPKQDRLDLTRATRANLSPIFSLFSDPEGAAWGRLAPVCEEPPFAIHTDADGTVNSLWRVTDPAVIEQVVSDLAGKELLIADGHHRYETARVYADEIGGPGDHNYVLMFLCALEDPGMTVFATHRLISGNTPERRRAIEAVAREAFEVEEIDVGDLVPPVANGDARGSFGYYDGQLKRALRLTLKDDTVAAAALPDKPDSYRRLDTAVLESLMLKRALGLTEDDISHLNGLGYSSDAEETKRLVDSGRFDAAFFLRPTPIDQVCAVAADGETMPPKSTYFYPKIPTGLLFNPLA